MAVFQDIIAAVLSEVVLAQHEANLTTQELAEQYRNHPLLKYLPVPSVSVGGTELTIHFAFVNADEATSSQDPEDIKPLEVIVDTKRLAALPPESIQTITLKLSPQQGVPPSSEANT